MIRENGNNPGAEAARIKGWWSANRWLYLRRASQIFFLFLFLTGPLFGLWIVKGTIVSSLTLDVLPLSDPFVALQSLFAGHVPASDVMIGAAIILVVYAVIGGRMFCSWVCPVNMVTDASHWLRERFGIEKGWEPNRQTRYWVLGAVLIVSFVTGTIAWEAVNPVSILHRELVFGTLFVAGFGWTAVVSVFLFDLLLARRGWCGHLCPVGAFYGLIGRFSLLRVSAARRDVCNDCLDCYAVCPEPQVITPALKGAKWDLGLVVMSQDCTNCGRCIDVCSEDVYRFVPRFDERTERFLTPGHWDEKRLVA